MLRASTSGGKSYQNNAKIDVGPAPGARWLWVFCQLVGSTGTSATKHNIGEPDKHTIRDPRGDKVCSRELASNRFGAREQTAVDRIHNRRSADHPPTEIASVQTLDGVLATLDLVELEVDVALGIGI
jgi:hypothetical protein